MTALNNLQQKQWHQAQALNNATVTVEMLPAGQVVRPSAEVKFLEPSATTNENVTSYDFRSIIKLGASYATIGLLFKDSR